MLDLGTLPVGVMTRRRCRFAFHQFLQERPMSKFLTFVAAALFALGSSAALAADAPAKPASGAKAEKPAKPAAAKPAASAPMKKEKKGGC
jgi:hypothetical protein